MTKSEARKKLDRSSLLEHRSKSRIFGNIDTKEHPLGAVEVINLVMIETEFIKKTREMFSRPSSFFEKMLKK